MANLLQLQNGTKSFGNKVLFNQAQFALNEGEHVAVIGPNGAGKTTLFKILAQQESLDSGQVIKKQGLRIGYLEQEAEWNLEVTPEEFFDQEPVHWGLWDIKKIGLELGLTEKHFQRPLKELSGGFRMRVKLLSLLAQDPDLMLLDEPTNFLDLESVLALENFLQSHKGAFMLISHDREFLKRTTEATLEIEGGDITKFPGDIDDYFEQKSELAQQMEAQIMNLEQKRKHLQSFVDRFRAKATKARQAQSRMKMLEKMTPLEKKALPVRARIILPPPIETGKEVLRIENASLGYPQKEVLKNVDLRLNRGQHWGVVGINGAGKSTFLKTLAEKIPLLSGSIAFGHQVKLSYYAQHVTEELSLQETVLDALERGAHSSCLKQDILNMAGSFLFSGEALEKPIRVLSGGEKSRVALAQTLLRKNPVLILDEPTNHLDFDTVESLTVALAKYEGALVVVSHDRSFVARVATQILEISHGQVNLYPGTYEDYLWSQLKGTYQLASTSPQNPPSLPAENKAMPEIKFNYKAAKKNLESKITISKRKVRDLENILENLIHEQKQTNLLLLQKSGPEAAQLAYTLSQIGKSIEENENEMLSIMEEQQSLEQELQQL